MTVKQRPQKVKDHCETDDGPRFRDNPWNWLLWQMDCHPRVAWMWVFLLLLNTILNILDLTGFGGR